MKIIILNNNFLGMVRQWQELFFHERYSNTIMENPDFVAIAKAYGIAGRTVEKREEKKSFTCHGKRMVRTDGGGCMDFYKRGIETYMDF